MNTQLVLTVLCDDRPGVVEQLAQTISTHHGNWLESRMAQLAGKFAGILQVAVADEHQQELRNALSNLTTLGFKIVVDTATTINKPECREFSFSVVGNDRPGIVREIAQAFAARHINMGELETACSSMPWSGEPLFEATGIIEVPKSVDMNELYDHLDIIADELAVDIRLESSTERSN
ncbi:glycine cleavage system protein R [Cellvibrio sp. pealriver]|uniref:glycine cleavage system protein R n=1 Tax=Cellvibrio sp. pealriver TaxID=1622269 RepID=UPI00066FDD02|nr:ACT domain-containing protein [Cellvibrio sp. pealriver]